MKHLHCICLITETQRDIIKMYLLRDIVPPLIYKYKHSNIFFIAKMKNIQSYKIYQD